MLRPSLLGCAVLFGPVSALAAPPPLSPVQVTQVATPRVLAIEVEGNRRFTKSQLVNALGQEVGGPLSQARIDEGIKTLWRDFHVHSKVQYRAVEGGVELKLIVQEMPVDLEPRFVGNVEEDDETVYEWAGLEVGAELFLHEAPLVRQRLIDNYLREGYYFVEVDVVMPSEDELAEGQAEDVIFQIREGPLVKVTSMEVEGADSFPDTGWFLWSSSFQEVADVELDGSKILFWWRDELVERTLEADLIAMREVYRSNGWFDAVVELERLAFNAERDRVKIKVRVDEGERYTVSGVDFEMLEYVDGEARPATSYYPIEELEGLLELEAGQPFTQKALVNDQRALRRRYGQDGYISHPSLGQEASWSFLEPRYVYDVDAHTVHLTYRIAQGRQQFIREVRLKGNVHTEDRVMRRLITVDPGDVADLTEIEDSLRRIRGTGFFDDPLNPQGHFQPTFRFVETDDPQYKDLEYEVEEGNDLQFQFTGNFSFDSGLYGGMTITKSNFALFDPPSSPWSLFGEIQDKRAFHGAGETLSLSLQPGTEFSQYRLRWTDPDIFDRHRDRYSLTVDGFQNYRFYKPYDEERRDLSLRLGRQQGPDSSIWAGVGVGDVKVSDLFSSGTPSLFSPLDVPTDLADQEGTSTLVHLDGGYNYNTLDSRFVPREGTRMQASTSLYTSALGSDFDFWKAQFMFDRYGQFGDELDDLRTGWALRGGFGVSDGLGDTDEVPYTERFFLGGTGSSFGLRGFKLRGVGPNEEDFSVGGHTFLRGAAEYRFPVITSYQSGSTDRFEVVRGALFLDAGVLGPDPWQLDLGEYRASTGIAFSLSIFPQVPITLSFGFPLVDGQGDDKRIFSFSIGFQ